MWIFKCSLFIYGVGNKHILIQQNIIVLAFVPISTSSPFDLEFDFLIRSDTLSSAALTTNVTKQTQIISIMQATFTQVTDAVYGDNINDDGEYTFTITDVTNNDDTGYDTLSDFDNDITVTFNMATKVK